ncbi:dachshund homolog dac-1-like [Eurosta solidaginis]|uniref:dachshund homolog dac-1-like n=1 Tax=Eurosta solidaginis TaxID=178769 RepID=UPI00353077B3
MDHNGEGSNDLDKFYSEENGSRSPTASTTNSTVCDKSQSLVDIANNTFKELCRTLENEQSKLLELEERRKKLQEEMQSLKLEIEAEKHTYRLNLVESLAENADAMCAKEMENLGSCYNMETGEDSGSEFHKELYTCYEPEETANREDAIHDSDSAGEDDNKHPNDIARSIQKKLTGLAADCVIEQFNHEDSTHET